MRRPLRDPGSGRSAAEHHVGGAQLAQFRVARLPEDAELLDGARRIATALLEADPELAEPEHALLDWAVKAAYGADALDPIPA